MTQSEREELERLVDEACSRLREHVDSVRIFVTRDSDDGQETAGLSRGRGNFYAQRGLVEEWLEGQREGERERIRRRVDEDDEGDDE